MSERLTPEEQAVELWNRLGNPKWMLHDLAAAIRSALAQRDAEWRKAVRSMTEDCSTECLRAADDNDCEDAAPLRALMKEG